MMHRPLNTWLVAPVAESGLLHSRCVPTDPTRSFDMLERSSQGGGGVRPSLAPSVDADTGMSAARVADGGLLPTVVAPVGGHGVDRHESGTPDREGVTAVVERTFICDHIPMPHRWC